MKQITSISVENQPLFRCLLAIDDPRVPGRCLYPLHEILFIILCGLIAGCDTWKSIELFARERYRWLKRFTDLTCGVPSHLTLARVFSLLDPHQFETCYREWISSQLNFIQEEFLHIDGKTSRGSSHRASGKKALHLVSAYLPLHGMTLGTEKTSEKSNEIKAIPALLKTLHIDGRIITIDAMGTQKGIANLIRLKKGHYLLALKKNHKKFYHKVANAFSRAEELQFKSMVYQQTSTQDYGHHRIEKRRYTILPSMYLPQYQQEWKNCQAFIRVESSRYCLAQKKEETSYRYYITSLPFQKYNKMCEAIRSHWSIENRLHYKLDVGLHEDNVIIHRGYAAENLAVMRKIVLTLLQKDKTANTGILLQRTRAALNTRYLQKVIGL